MVDHIRHEHVRQVKPPSTLANRLRFAVFLAATVFVVELIGGLAANSLALISDAGHVFTDVVALSLSWFAVKQSQKPATGRMTYGYHRIGVLVAAVNAATIVGIALFIFYEAYQRLREPPEVESALMLGVALVGLIANLVVIRKLHGDQAHSLNVRSAFLHAWGDALSSVGVIVAAVIIAFTGMFWVDPAVSVFIGVVIAVAAWGIIKEAIEVFIEASPSFLDNAQIAASLCRVSGVNGIHDLHTWSITPQLHALSCHVVVDDRMISEGARILDNVNEVLKQKFSIEHSTVQIESTPCTDDAMYCTLIPESDDGHSHRGHDHAD